MNIYIFVLWVCLTILFMGVHEKSSTYELRLFDEPQEWRFASHLFTDTSGRFRLVEEKTHAEE